MAYILFTSLYLFATELSRIYNIRHKKVLTLQNLLFDLNKSCF